MKLSFVLIACVLGTAGAMSLKKQALQPSMRFVQLWNRPEATQDFQGGEDWMEAKKHGYGAGKGWGTPPDGLGTANVEKTNPKFTPGPSCYSYTKKGCKACAEVTPCIWIPHDPHNTEDKSANGHCTEERAQGDFEPDSALGERMYECDAEHKFEVVDTPDDEMDDYSELHVNGSPTNTDIAVLNKAEPVYTVAQELGVGEGPESEAAGDWLVNGNNRREYEGNPDMPAGINVKGR